VSAREQVKAALRKVREIEKQVQDLEDEAAEQMDLAVGIAMENAGLNPVENIVVGGWECDNRDNLVGTCVYDDDEDPLHDDCLFCHAPEERK